MTPYALTKRLSEHAPAQHREGQQSAGQLSQPLRLRLQSYSADKTMRARTLAVTTSIDAAFWGKNQVKTKRGQNDERDCDRLVDRLAPQPESARHRTTVRARRHIVYAVASPQDAIAPTGESAAA